MSILYHYIAFYVKQVILQICNLDNTYHVHMIAQLVHRYIFENAYIIPLY